MMAAVHEAMVTPIAKGWVIVKHEPGKLLIGGTGQDSFFTWLDSDEAQGRWRSCDHGDLIKLMPEAEIRLNLCYKAFSDPVTAMAFKMRFC
jgi:hypothetical protein